ncbi:hypothetical protein DFR70_101350 [Nocardia tenerifensis]|uniref:Uncharacterized protein n=1 Tax=Nocardia tenerifensis TaxID=228006 RepID=A0A318KDS7_9NOCA|nr:hypothetical protein DFR70_101350 [Nocardia tenerifensis]
MTAAHCHPRTLRAEIASLGQGRGIIGRHPEAVRAEFDGGLGDAGIARHHDVVVWHPLTARQPRERVPPTRPRPGQTVRTGIGTAYERDHDARGVADPGSRRSDFRLGAAYSNAQVRGPPTRRCRSRGSGVMAHVHSRTRDPCATASAATARPIFSVVGVRDRDIRALRRSRRTRHARNAHAAAASEQRWSTRPRTLSTRCHTSTHTTESLPSAPQIPARPACTYGMFRTPRRQIYPICRNR